jgi:putative ABC transport system substrate-binding protein
MRRRLFIKFLGGAAAVWPLPARAQQPYRPVPLVGAIWGGGNASAPIIVHLREAFQRGLREDGYVEGRNITIEHRYGASPNEFHKAAEELVQLDPNVIVAGSTPAVLAAKGATSAIPIVGVSMADPVADGLVMNLARPAGNVTGNTFIGPELGPKRLQLLREIVPAVTRVAALQHPGVYSERTMKGMLTELEEKARETRTQLQLFSASRPEDFDTAFDSMVKERAEALTILPSPMFYVNHRHLVDLAARRRLPTIYPWREAVGAGGLVCYAIDFDDLFRRAAKYVLKILGGAKPGDLPVEQPTKFELLINLKTAGMLGLTIPQLLLSRADDVIE